MAYDDDDEWPEPERDPEKLEAARERMHSMAAQRQRMLRWTYAILGVLVVIVILLAVLR